MSLPADYLEYPKRRHGMDHDLYAWSMLEDRPKIAWRDGRALALWINVCIEHFPLNPSGQGFSAPGGMSMPYPDLRHYTLRDYGNRVGIYRILDALSRHGLRASLAVSAELAGRYPALMRELAATGHEWLGHGWNMDRVHHGGMDEDSERNLIAESLAALAPHAPGPIRGWLSPPRSQSQHTPALLGKAGIAWCADWVNDELPYRLGPIVNLPLSLELEDRFVVMENLHAEGEWADQVVDACDFMLEEAGRSGHGRVLALNLHAWVMGQPHRIGHLERVLAHLARRRDALWNAAPSAIVQHWQHSGVDDGGAAPVDAR